MQIHTIFCVSSNTTTMWLKRRDIFKCFCHSISFFQTSFPETDFITDFTKLHKWLICTSRVVRYGFFFSFHYDFFLSCSNPLSCWFILFIYSFFTEFSQCTLHSRAYSPTQNVYWTATECSSPWIKKRKKSTHIIKLKPELKMNFFAHLILGHWLCY